MFHKKSANTSERTFGVGPKIAAKKEELAVLRHENPESYPAFLDDLLDHGCIHLYEHLIHTRSHSTRLKVKISLDKISFSALSHLVIETREAVIQKVKKSIPKKSHLPIVFILGITGVGKSTTTCFLRGDKMVLKNFNYESQNDTHHLISHSLNQSCTFLPNIEKTKDLIIVDFPGFFDSNGNVISLGVEFALKFLITECCPKILILESITNTGDRYVNIAKNSRLLDRLVHNKNDCMLGITQYSHMTEFTKIKDIEQKQRKDLSEPSIEERVLSGKIDACNERLNDEDFSNEHKQKIQQKIKEMQLQLNELQQKRFQAAQQPLAETDEKKSYRNKIKELEDTLLYRTGCGMMIRFDELDDDHLNECIEVLSSPTLPICVNPKPVLDEFDQKFLETRFKQDLMKELELGGDIPQRKFMTHHEFVEYLNKYSLISAIARPEIGEFFHLPEMDPITVRQFDHEMIMDCVKKHTNILIGLCRTLTPFKAFLNNVQETKNVLEVKRKIDYLEMYIRGILSVSMENDNEWNRILNNNMSVFNSADELLKLPGWIKQFSYIEIITPETIYFLGKEFDIKMAHMTVTDEMLEKCHVELRFIIHLTNELNTIKKEIELRLDIALNQKIHKIDYLENPVCIKQSGKKNIENENDIVRHLQRHSATKQPYDKNQQQALYEAEYQKQLPRRRLFTALVIVGAFVLTPVSLLITVPLWYYAKKNERIQKVTSTLEDETTIRSNRRAWKSTYRLLKIKKDKKEINATEKVNDDTSNAMVTKYVDLGRYHRDLLFKTKNPQEITPSKILESQRESAAILAGIRNTV